MVIPVYSNTGFYEIVYTIRIGLFVHFIYLLMTHDYFKSLIVGREWKKNKEGRLIYTIIIIATVQHYYNVLIYRKAKKVISDFCCKDLYF